MWHLVIYVTFKDISMKANEFIKEHGLDDAKKLLSITSRMNMSGLVFASLKDGGNLYFEVKDLKRLIDSHDLVGVHGYEKSKEIVANAPSDNHFYSWKLGDSGVYDKTVNIGELRKAIADVESCQ